MADLSIGVFDMNSLTVTTSVADYFDDDLKVPINEGVSKGNINSTGFLAEITAGFAEDKHNGVDQTIIRGDKVMEVKGNLYENILYDHGAHIGGKKELKIDGMRHTEIEKNDELEIHGNQYTDVYGDTQTTNYGGVVAHVIGHHLYNEVSRWIQWEGVQKATIAIDNIQVILLSDLIISGGSLAISSGFVEIGCIHEELMLVKAKMTLAESELAALRPSINIAAVTNFCFFAKVGFFPHGMVPPFHPGA